MNFASCDRCGKTVPEMNLLLHQAHCELNEVPPLTAAVAADAPQAAEEDGLEQKSVRELKR
jgi:hypothetical protein